MKTWNIAETRRLIKLRYGDDQCSLAQHCLRSVVERMRHARYHFQEVRAVLKANIEDRLDTESIGESICNLMFPQDSENLSDVEFALMKAEANTIACAQSIHSTGDYLAHVVYFGLDLNRGSPTLREQDVSLTSVLQMISKDPRYENVRTALDEMASDTTFDSLRAIANYTKHRGIFEPRLRITPIDTQASYAFEFGSFRYSNKTYAEREIEQVLAPAYLLISDTIVRTGNALNDILSE